MAEAVNREEVDDRLARLDEKVKQNYKDRMYTQTKIRIMDLDEEEQVMLKRLAKLKKDDSYVEFTKEEKQALKTQRIILNNELKALNKEHEELLAAKRVEENVIITQAMNFLNNLIETAPSTCTIADPASAQAVTSKRLEILQEIRSLIQESIDKQYPLHPLYYRSINFYFVVGEEDPEVNDSGRRSVMIRHCDFPNRHFMLISVGKILMKDGKVTMDEEDALSASDMDGYVYRGALNPRGERHGSGMCIYPDGAFYECEWTKGLREGKGICIFPNGDRYEGEFKRGKMESEQSVLLMANQDRYEGSFHNNTREGLGVMHYANGDYYEGMFHHNTRHGNGRCTFAESGLTYDGEWVDDKRCGEGRIFNSEGGHYEGGWKDNAKHGMAYVHFPNDLRYDGKWKEGARRGPADTFSSDKAPTPEVGFVEEDEEPFGEEEA